MTRMERVLQGAMVAAGVPRCLGIIACREGIRWQELVGEMEKMEIVNWTVCMRGLGILGYDQSVTKVQGVTT